MRTVQARYEDGALKPDEPLPLRPGERVGVIVVRQPDAARWNLARLVAHGSEDSDMAAAGLDEWADALDAEDER